MKKLLVVGDDKVGRELISKLGYRKNLIIVIDSSSGLKRIVKLVYKKRININLLLKMVLAEILRKNYRIKEFKKIYSNSDLISIIDNLDIDTIYLFRAGLIINKKILSLVVNIFNVHCASIPSYGGIGSIRKAIKDEAYDQQATLHRINERIDDGEVIKTQPYRLVKGALYYKNENIAYKAGIQLLLNELRHI